MTKRRFHAEVHRATRLLELGPKYLEPYWDAYIYTMGVLFYYPEETEDRIATFNKNKAIPDNIANDPKRLELIKQGIDDANTFFKPKMGRPAIGTGKLPAITLPQGLLSALHKKKNDLKIPMTDVRRKAYEEFTKE